VNENCIRIARRLFEEMVLQTIRVFAPKKEGVAGWRKLHDEDILLLINEKYYAENAESLNSTSAYNFSIKRRTE
jgi:hypothetical protein